MASNYTDFIDEMLVSVPDTTKAVLANLKIGDKTITERQVNRGTNLTKYSKDLAKDKSNIFLKNSLNRGKDINAFETEKETTYQNMVMDMFENLKPRVADADPLMETGKPLSLKKGKISNTLDQGLETTKLNAFANSKLSPENIKAAKTNLGAADVTGMGFTTGDIVGTVGSVVGSVSQMANTIANAKATKQVVNHYAGFNEKALAANQFAKDQIGYNKDAAKTELERTLNLAENNARARTRGSATSLNTLRSLDLGVDISTNEAKVGGRNQLESVFGQQMLSALNVDTQLLSQKDQMEMAGATAADDANAANLDSFYTNFAQNIANATNTVQKLGADINLAKHRNDFIKLLPQTNAHGIGVDENMNMFANRPASKYITPAKTIREVSPEDDYLNFDYMSTFTKKLNLPKFNTNRPI